MRSGALEVLSVGTHVFSSDHRVMVGKGVLGEDEGEVWKIKIASVRTSDKGLYQCQVTKGSLFSSSNLVWLKVKFKHEHPTNSCLKFWS